MFREFPHLIRQRRSDEYSSMPSCAGLRAHVELARVSGYIVCETFRVAPRNRGADRSAASIDTALTKLQTWQTKLPHSLQMPDSLSHSDPSCCMLHMAHNQLILLTTRPIFFAAIKQAVAQRVVKSQYTNEPHSQQRYVQACSTAAHHNLLLAQRVIQPNRILQAGLHFIFNAAVILLLNRIINVQDMEDGSTSHMGPIPPTNDQLELSIHFAVQTFENEARTGTNYPKDCCKVLQDLRALTDRYMVSRYPVLDQKNLTDKVQSAQTNTDFSIGFPPAHQQLGEQEGIYDEMMTWVQSDGLQLHHNFFI
jgi:hypothetical protein